MCVYLCALVVVVRRCLFIDVFMWLSVYLCICLSVYVSVFYVMMCFLIYVLDLCVHVVI